MEGNISSPRGKRRRGDRQPNLHDAVGEEELRGHYADHNVRLARQDDLLANNPAIFTECAFPKRIGKDRDVFCADLAIVMTESSAEEGSIAEKGKEIPPHIEGGYISGALIPEFERYFGIHEGDHAFESRSLVTQISQVRSRNSPLDRCCLGTPENNQSIGVPVRKGMQENRVGEAEDRRY